MSTWRRVGRGITRRRWLAGAVLVAAAWALACGVLLMRASSDLRAGRAAARDARGLLTAEAVAAGTPIAPLRLAASHLDRAAAATGNPLLLPVRYLPIVGRQLRSVHQLSAAVAEVADAAADGVGTLYGVLDGRGLAGAARVEQLRTLDEAVSKAERRVRAVDDLGPSDGLLAPLADARNEVAVELAEAKATLADAVAGTGAALRLLEGPRRYLLMAANNAEMRAGSGMWLSGCVLTTEGGQFSLGPVKPIYEYEVPEGAVTPTGDLAARWGWLRPEIEWRNLMASPRFAESAELAARMWVAAGEGEVDGVLVIDPVGLRALIASTGPVELEDGSTVAADGVLADLLHDQYADIGPGDDRRTGERRDRLEQLTGATFAALQAGSWSPATLARELGAAVRGRHVLAWSSHAEEQVGWEAAGLGGELTSTSLAVSLLNTGGNKLDWFVRTDVSLAIQPGAASTVVRLSIRIVNTTPPGESGYVAGPNPALANVLSAGDYRGMFAVNVPGAAADIKVNGVDKVEVQGPDGPTRVVGATVVIRRGETEEITVEFELPGSVGSMLIEPSARVPPSEWHYEDDSWQDDRRRTANW
jgi:hypothetical protein